MLVSLCFDAPVSCEKRMWLLMRSPDATVISGTMNSTLCCGENKKKKSHKKLLVPKSFVLKMCGFEVFSGRTIFMRP